MSTCDPFSSPIWTFSASSETIDIMLKLATTVSSCGDLHFAHHKHFCCEFIFYVFTSYYVTSREHTGDIYGPYVRASFLTPVLTARTYERQKTHPYVRAVHTSFSYVCCTLLFHCSLRGVVYTRKNKFLAKLCYIHILYTHRQYNMYRSVVLKHNMW